MPTILLTGLGFSTRNFVFTDKVLQKWACHPHAPRLICPWKYCWLLRKQGLIGYLTPLMLGVKFPTYMKAFSNSTYWYYMLVRYAVTSLKCHRPTKSCQFYRLVVTCQQVVTNLSISSSCDKSVKIKLVVTCYY